MAGEMHIGAKLAQLARWHGDRAAIVDETRRLVVPPVPCPRHPLRQCAARHRPEDGDRDRAAPSRFREYLEADYGAMAAGFVRVPIDPRLTRRELIELLRHAGARALVTHADFAEKVDGLADDVETLRSRHRRSAAGVGLAYEDAAGEGVRAAAAGRRRRRLATLNFSGGTTGAPKAVMLRHRNLMTVAQNTIARLRDRRATPSS